MSGEIKFNEFPLSYRLSQGSIFLAIFSGIATLKALSNNLHPLARTIIASIVGITILFGLIVSSYTIIRYPYLSLVATDDYFLKAFPNSQSCLYTVLKTVSILTLIVLVVSFIASDFKPEMVLWLAYCLLLLAFLFYLTFFYEPVANPTISTYIRTTLGIGIIFFPIFLPILVIASLRCRALLDRAELDLD